MLRHPRGGAIRCLVPRPAVRGTRTVFIGFSRRCEFFNSPACTGSVGVQTAALALQDSAGSWLTIAAQIARPAGAVAARCDFSFETASGASFDGWLDATLFVATGAIFSDGFESGDTTAWSATAP